MECEYCEQILQTQSSLKQHQKTAKYCLSKQNKSHSEEEHTCNFCSKSFTLKSSLEKHLRICKSKQSCNTRTITTFG
jgi:hypothetical protein